MSLALTAVLPRPHHLRALRRRPLLPLGVIVLLLVLVSLSFPLF